MCVYTHTHRERERERDTHTHVCVCVCVYSHKKKHTKNQTGMREIAIDFLERVLSLDVSNVLGIFLKKKLNVFSALVM